MITNEQAMLMLEEYEKGGKFKEYVDKGCSAYNSNPEKECNKTTVWEYYQSVVNGVNKEK